MEERKIGLITMLQKRWTIKQSDPQLVEELQEALRIHPVFCALLVQRGIHSFEQARNFFRADRSQWHDPFLMKGMQEAVRLIRQVIEQQERILIYGDYDVDGTTAVAVVYSYFRHFYPHIEFYIPHRFNEGYGISEKGINYAIEQGISLIITLDCGIKSVELVEKARQHDIDVIICDHHMPDEHLPRANAILNPKQADCPYPYKELCGCGVGFKLISAFDLVYPQEAELVNRHLDLVATAIAADIVPITGENRTLCVLGLEKANRDPSMALLALRNISQLERPFTISDLVFIIAPRVNAAGRMDDARKAVELFTADNLALAETIARGLHEDNNDRRDIDKQTTEEALLLISEDEQHAGQLSTVVYQPHWHKGVIGIVASRLIDHHYRPTIVLTHSNGRVTGSARSIKGFNLFEGLSHCAEYLETFGGHYFAAGLTLQEKKLNDFRKRFDEVVKEILPEDKYEPEIEIDAELFFQDIHEKFLGILIQFAPHGPENMRPVFLSRGVRNYQNQSVIAKEKHIRFQVQQAGSQPFSGIGFNLADKFHLLQEDALIDLIYHIEVNEWQGRNTIQLKVLDIRAAE